MADFEQLFYNMIPGMLYGALIGGLAFAAKSTIHTTDNFTQKLKFQPEAFDMDLHCAELFLKLQQYRMLASEDFDEAGSEADSLFCLEKQLVRNEIKWELFHPVTSLGYAREMSKRLQNFLDASTAALYLDRMQQRDNFDQQRQDAMALLTPEDQAMRAQLEKDIEHGKEMCRHINQLIKEIKACVHKHVTKITGGFRAPLRGLGLSLRPDAPSPTPPQAQPQQQQQHNNNAGNPMPNVPPLQSQNRSR
jgi:hypothetical protein